MEPATIDTSPTHPFRRAVLRGLGVVLPPLLTIVFLLWMWNAVRTYILTPAKDLALAAAVQQNWDVLTEPPQDVDRESFGKDALGQVKTFKYNNKTYARLSSDEWIPAHVFKRVRENPGEELPVTAEGYYRRYYELEHFHPAFMVPLLFCLLILVLYLLGKIIAARIGRALWNYVEGIIHHVPFINTVYSTVKKVTDVVFADNEIQFNRVVAVQYPSRGIWSVGFVTGESLPEIFAATGEPMLSVLMPTSPAPFTGFTVSVRKSETIELSISVDQAFQFVVSCGVVIPGLNVPGQGLRRQDIRQTVEGLVAKQPPLVAGEPPATTSDVTESSH